MSESDKSGKPELIADDILRIEQQSKYEWPSQRAMFEKGAEWVYSTNVLPLRARIAELEAACNLVITKVSAVSHPVHGAGDFILDDIVKILNKALQP